MKILRNQEIEKIERLDLLYVDEEKNLCDSKATPRGQMTLGVLILFLK